MHVMIMFLIIILKVPIAMMVERLDKLILSEVMPEVPAKQETDKVVPEVMVAAVPVVLAIMVPAVKAATAW